MSLDATRAGSCGARPADGPGRGLRILVAPDYRRDNPYQALLAGALEALGARVSFARGYRRVLPLRRMLGQDGPRPHVLHLHWLAPYLRGRNALTKSVYALRLALDVALVRHAGVRVVWTVHNLVGHEQTRPAIELWCRRRLARLADAIIVHSERARELVAERYDVAPDRIAVIPHGHYRDVYGPALPGTEARQRLGLPTRGRVFLFFGMIRPYKGVLTLLRAWAQTPELQREHTLVIAGEAPDPEHRDAVQRAAEAAPNVRLCLGRVPDEDVATYLSAADVVVLPFERALTSGSLELARSFGKPVVHPDLASLTCGDGEWEASTTYSASAGAEALREALLRAGDKSETAVAREGPVFDWSEVARAHKDVYG